MTGSPPNLHTMVPRQACIQGVLKVKVKVKDHVIRALLWCHEMFAIQYLLTFYLYMHSLYEAPWHSLSNTSVRQLDVMSTSWNELLRHWRSGFINLSLRRPLVPPDRLHGLLDCSSDFLCSTVFFDGWGQTRVMATAGKFLCSVNELSLSLLHRVKHTHRSVADTGFWTGRISRFETEPQKLNSFTGMLGLGLGLKARIFDLGLKAQGLGFGHKLRNPGPLVWYVIFFNSCLSAKSSAKDNKPLYNNSRPEVTNGDRQTSVGSFWFTNYRSSQWC